MKIFSERFGGIIKGITFDSTNGNKMVNTTETWNNNLGDDELIPDTMLEDDDTERDEPNED